MEKIYLAFQTFLSGIIAWISARLGILFPVLCVFLCMMIVDYITGMIASKREALDHPGDPSYGWSSKKGSKGIIRKVGYLCVIAVAMVVDFIISKVAAEVGLQLNIKAFFGLLVSVWYLLNELLSIIENAGRMGAAVPEWLKRYIAVLKGSLEDQSKEK